MSDESNSRWTFGGTDGRTAIWHVDGVPWHKAPLPSRLHRCARQSYGWINYFTWIERCACGAIRHDDDHRWARRNERRAA